MRNLGIVGLIILSGVAIGAGQTKKIQEVPVKLSGTTDGAQLFKEHCAVCHGTDAKGRGPAADALKKAPTDLTQISRKNGGKFPGLAVQQKIKGGEIIEHGTVEMPMWGKLLVGPGRSKTDADVRIYALLLHIEQIQAK
jgi:mono/diheme cytochrome c family protein